MVTKRNPALIVLKALLAGIPIPVDGEEWVFESGIFGPKRVMLNQDTLETREVVLGVDMSLGAFVTWCEKLPEDIIIQLAFSLGMESMKKVRK